MKVYIVINIFKLLESEVYRSKKQILDRFNVSHVTLNKAIKNNTLISRYIIIETKVIPNNNKGKERII